MIKSKLLWIGGLVAIAVVIAATLSMFAAASANGAHTIDFEGLGEGDIISSLSTGGGGISGDAIIGTVSVFGLRPGFVPNQAMIFDSTCMPGGTPAHCTGDDADLFNPALGNVLIVSEDNDSSDPDDADVRGELFDFDFSSFGPTGVITVNSLDALDVELGQGEGGASIEVFSGGLGGVSLGIFGIPDTGNGGLTNVAIGVSGVDFMRVTLNGSGAIDNIELEVGNPAIDIEKTPDLQTVLSGTDVTFTIEVTNTGDVDLLNVEVTDVIAPDCDNEIGDLAVGASVTYECTLADVTEDLTNVAEVTGEDENGNPVDDEDPAEVDVVRPAINIEKTPDLQTIMSGADVTFTIEVTNTGDVDLVNVEVTDVIAPDCDNEIGDLAVGASETYECTLVDVTADLTNVAEVTGEDENGNPVDDEDPAEVDIESQGAGLLIIDEDSIDNGMIFWAHGVTPSPDNDDDEFSDVNVNDDKVELGMRDQLRFFRDNVGVMITLQTGEVGDEGWFAPQFIPESWAETGPTGDGITNFVGLNGGLGDGLGVGDDPEELLDKIPDVTPLRATGLEGLEGGTFCAVVYDSDVSINFDPLNGSLKGSTLGIVAFMVKLDGIDKLDDFSSSTLPSAEITILDADEVCRNLNLVSAPLPPTSSEPFDIDPENPSGGYLP